MRLSLFILLTLLSILSLGIGVQSLNWNELFHLESKTWLILLSSRFPRLVTLILSGVGLSLSGVILQHIVRNRFIEPATSGGVDAAKLGILVSIIMIPSSTAIERMGLAVSFCLLSSLLFIAIIRQIKVQNSVLIPVLGLMYGGVLSAIAEFYAYQHHIIQSMQGWLLGDFSRIVQGRYEIIYLIVPAVICIYFYAYRFTVLGMGENITKNLGLDYIKTTGIGLFLVAIIVASSVITVGAIPFIGLVIPNLVVLRYGENFAKTLPIIALGGACLLLFCDVIGRLIIYPYEVPIALTAGIIGGIVFLFLMIKRVKKR
ncbi:iron chelate uptake ABC transporter family permease subunit [Pelistega sp. NLN82]|uniref:Iron chelate uptake ABC transporter family permease subunit n=1 Tax=Pelistega ratti TaxID=2652177 RepID=A0A6L9Y4Y2_9BURK|nr:iron chelate uptake ABC transporter family permease subunit [Pelistega ratti]NEN75306.1 iron chelate uptake ABC transporter family permease subunit [Pelistega ratti]